METAKIVQTYVQTLVWPSVVLGSVLAFRRQIRELFTRMRRIETLGGAAEFEAMVREVADMAEEVQESSHRGVTPSEARRLARPVSASPPLDVPSSGSTEVLHRLVPEHISGDDVPGDRRIDPLLDDAFKMVENLPATAIVTAHARMESFIHLFLRKVNGAASSTESSLISALGQIGVSGQTLSLAQRLIDLGGTVRYDNVGVTRAAAIQYIESCTAVLSEIRGMASRLTPPPPSEATGL